MGVERKGQLTRAFIAVQLGESGLLDARSAIHKLESGPQGDAVRWVRAENLHVTLRFLGNIDQDQIDRLQPAVATRVARFPPFDLSVGQAGLFPRGKRPRVVAAALEPEQPLVRLAATVEEAVRAVGLPGEDRVFRAHLTLGRIKRNAPKSLTGLIERIDQANTERKTPAPSNRVTRLVLFRSDLKPDGPVYTELWAAALSGA